VHVLIPFDIVPVSKHVPFGVAPASERAVTYAIEVFGQQDDASITAVNLSAPDDDLPADIGASEIQAIADDHGVAVSTETRSLQNADSMDAIRRAILDIVETEDVDAVVMGYEEKSFVDEVFHESTANRILETHDVPVTLVP
jgi:nucleotide-binding universal stress UspA family protein